MSVRQLKMFAAPLLILSSVVAEAQYQPQGPPRHDRDRYYDGLQQGGRGGNYHHRDDGYVDRRQQGGIGPGKGALIGGAGGAVLGAVFGGGLKGSLIGGAAGAGIGAVAGKVHQNNVRRNDRYYRR